MTHLSQSDSDDRRFYIDARGFQEASAASVEFDVDRILITVDGADRIGLTRIQTEELAIWLVTRLIR